MKRNWIQNKEALATSESRRHVLDIIEAGFVAIDTESVIQSAVSLLGNTLKIKEHSFNLEGVEHIYVIGFGKASCLAAFALEKILGGAIKQGIAIGLVPVACEYIKTYGASHPVPTVQNVELSEKILEMSRTLTERDLVITIVSGGGSALLCWPMKECEQANRLYHEFLKTGGDIKELNTVRKHISLLKGGGLAKYLYPAQVVGLIFSDVPGNNCELIASGPTYKDTTTVADAQKIIEKYSLGVYELNDTPKDDKYFERVVNVPLVSNIDVLEAMREKAELLGLGVKIISAELYDSTADVAEMFVREAVPGSVVLGAGEPKLVVTKTGGSGGRCQRLGMDVLPKLGNGDVFAAVASDGLDNSSAAGVVEDGQTLQRLEELGLDIKDYKERFDSLTFYEKLGNELLITGPTEANVSDFMILYRT